MLNAAQRKQYDILEKAKKQEEAKRKRRPQLPSPEDVSDVSDVSHLEYLKFAETNHLPVGSMVWWLYDGERIPGEVVVARDVEEALAQKQLAIVHGELRYVIDVDKLCKQMPAS